MDKTMTKEEFKARWESNEEGGGITFDDIADCAKAWGLYSRPKCAPINLVTYNVCKAANIKKEDMPPNPDEKEDEEEDEDKDYRAEIEELHKLTSDFALRVYRFVCNYNQRRYGCVTLQEAIDRHFDYN